MTSEQKQRVLAALYRRAVGYTATEEHSEFALNADGQWEEVKRKVSAKEVPPELNAIKTILDTGDDEDEMTEEELLRERDRLLKLLDELRNR